MTNERSTRAALRKGACPQPRRFCRQARRIRPVAERIVTSATVAARPEPAEPGPLRSRRSRRREGAEGRPLLPLPTGQLARHGDVWCRWRATCHRQPLTSFGERLANSSRSPAPLRDFGVKLPQSQVKDLADVRNRAIHKGHHPSLEEGQGDMEKAHGVIWRRVKEGQACGRSLPSWLGRGQGPTPTGQAARSAGRRSELTGRLGPVPSVR
jgi:hypothetical protein